MSATENAEANTALFYSLDMMGHYTEIIFLTCKIIFFSACNLVHNMPNSNTFKYSKINTYKRKICDLLNHLKLFGICYNYMNLFILL